MDAISQMPTGIYRTILIDRYINCKKWDDIAADMHYSVRHVTRLHGAALAEMVSVNVLLCPTADNI